MLNGASCGLEWKVKLAQEGRLMCLLQGSIISFRYSANWAQFSIKRALLGQLDAFVEQL